MNHTVRASKFLLIVAITSSAPLWLRASLYAQQGVGASVSEQPAVPIAATSDFEVKVGPHGFLAQRKGSDEWLEVSKLSEPIVVGQLDSDHTVYLATKAIKPPKIKHSEDPKYPDSELLSRKRSLVLLHMIVDDKGIVRAPTVDESASPAFAKAAIEAVNKWMFEPAKLDRQPVAVLIRVELQFGCPRECLF